MSLRQWLCFVRSLIYSGRSSRSESLLVLIAKAATPVEALSVGLLVSKPRGAQAVRADPTVYFHSKMSDTIL